ncbi:aminoglycoside adenylyltransferase domain-containing protein [Streptomyces sp. NPDC001795]|uniref:aminoglycoside adenylyltransferase domain-containing protein n=1 Tax=Streptomyces sp. NPDC001795 TaxID=3154525 RepID=UPI003317F873
MFTPFEELDALLADFTRSVRDILGDTFVGAYVQGSFALRAGDMHSDCDFVVATTVLPSGSAEAELRRLHDEIPTRRGFWTKHLEGSYANTTSLRSIDGIGVRWLFCDHGHRELLWDTHCNSPHTRWILRNHGITLAGPPITDLVDEVPTQAMRAALPEVLPGIKTWAPFDMAWTQRYIVSTYCRVLFTLHTGQVASKRGALEWACENLDPGWRPLFIQVIADRTRGWDPADPPRPGSLEATYAFAAYAQSFAD